MRRMLTGLDLQLHNTTRLRFWLLAAPHGPPCRHNDNKLFLDRTDVHTIERAQHDTNHTMRLALGQERRAQRLLPNKKEYRGRAHPEITQALSLLTDVPTLCWSLQEVYFYQVHSNNHIANGKRLMVGL